MLELVTDHWRKVGIALFIRTSQRDVFRAARIAGEIMMSMWSGIDNGVPTADMNPGELAPTAEDQLQWPIWGYYYRDQRPAARPRPARGRRAGRAAQDSGGALDRA